MNKIKTYSVVVLNVSSSVCRPLITSTNFMTGTGFIKCIPITLLGLFTLAAILVIDIDEVFVASITFSLVILSKDLKISFLMSNFSVAASTTKLACLKYSKSSIKLNLPVIKSFSSLFNVPLVISLSRRELINFFDFSN